MELKQLTYFVSAAEQLSFTAAARSCYVVQSAISQQIAQLEKELGVSLFVRGKRSLELTQEGKIFLAEAQAILDQVAYSKNMIELIRQPSHVTLKLGFLGSVLSEETAEKLSQYRKENPDVRLMVSGVSRKEIIGALETKELDAVLTLRQEDYGLYPWLSLYPIREEPVYLTVPADHLKAGEKAVSMSDFPDTPIILLGDSDKRPRLAEWTHVNGKAEVYQYVNSQEMVELLVAAGYGISPCVESACRPRPGIRYIPLSDAPKETVCLLCRRENEETALKKFLHLFF